MAHTPDSVVIGIDVGSTTVIFTVVDPTSMPITTFSGVLLMGLPCFSYELDVALD